jgi:UrcA family protein
LHAGVRHSGAGPSVNERAWSSECWSNEPERKKSEKARFAFSDKPASEVDISSLRCNPQRSGRDSVQIRYCKSGHAELEQTSQFASALCRANRFRGDVTRLHRVFGAVTFAAAMMLASVPALAQRSTEGPAYAAGQRSHEAGLSVNVNYGDLDLTTEAGRHELQHRIRFTAWRVCDMDAAPGTTFAETTNTVQCATKTTKSVSATLRHIIGSAAARTAATSASTSEPASPTGQ